MKKFARILLVGALTLSLAACGSDDKETEAESKRNDRAIIFSIWLLFQQDYN